MELYNRWKYRTKLVDRLVTIFIAFFVINAVLNSILQLGGGMQFLQPENWIPALITFASFMFFMFYIFNTEKKLYKIFIKKGAAKKLKKEQFHSFWILFNQLISNEEERLTNIKVYFDANDFSLSPFVFENDKTNYLIVPLGFLKFLEDKPKLANAVLIHELAHIIQKDTTILAFCRIHKRLYLKILIIALPFIILGNISALHMLDGEVITDLGELGRTYYSFTTVHYLIAVLIVVLFTLISSAIIYTYLKWIFRLSETNADMYAYLKTLDSSLSDMLIYSNSQSNSSNKSLKKRIKNLQKIERINETSTNILYER